MRPIDADALVENESWDADTRAGYVQVVDVGSILAAPTIDLVNHGQWIDTPEKYDRVYCSRCAENCEDINEIDHSGFFRFFRYCPDCGARMDLEEPREMD